MKDIQKKIKRIQPIVNIRRHEMEKEALALSNIRSQKLELVKTMRNHQQAYLHGIEQLNAARGSIDRKNLDVLENSVDFARDRWTDTFRQVQEIEKKEKNQLQQLTIAQRDLKIVEILNEKYHQEMSIEMNRKEQAEMNEVAIARHFRK